MKKAIKEMTAVRPAINIGSTDYKTQTVVKLQFNDKDGIVNTYVFRVAKKSSRVPTDIITEGELLGQKLGKQGTEDIHGNPLGTLAKGWNGCEKIFGGQMSDMSTIANTTYETLIVAALSRAVSLSLNGKTALPAVVVDKAFGKPLLNDGTKYFIEGWKVCASCPEIIHGRHDIIISGMKPVKQGPYYPTDECTPAAKPGKYLCKSCEVKSVVPEELPDDSEAGKLVKRAALWPATSGVGVTSTVTEKVTITLDLTPNQVIDIMNYLKGGKV